MDKLEPKHIDQIKAEVTRLFPYVGLYQRFSADYLEMSIGVKVDGDDSKLYDYRRIHTAKVFRGFKGYYVENVQVFIWEDIKTILKMVDSLVFNVLITRGLRIV